MATAYSLLPKRFADGRHGAVLAGLKRAGYRIVHGPGAPKSPDDVLVTWTVHRGSKENAARAFEAAGGRTIVCEEASLQVPSTKRGRSPLNHVQKQLKR